LTGAEATGGSRRHLWTALIGVAVSVGLLAWAMRNVNLAEVGSEIRRARPMPVLLGVLLATGSFVLRAIRWKLLIKSDTGEEVPFWPRWHAVAMGFMANNLLPLRAGEFVRAYAISRLGKVRMTGAITSLVVERVFDALTLVMLLAAGLLLSNLPASTVIAGIPLARIATVAGIGALIAVAIGIAIVIQPTLLEHMVRAVLPSGKIQDGLARVGHEITQGLTGLRSPARLAGVVFWSLTLWLMSALSFYVMFAAFDIQVSFGGALLMQSAMAFGIAVPSTPGYIGPFEAALVAVLNLFKVPDTTAFSYAVTYHLTTLLPVTLLGVLSLAVSPIAFKDLRTQPKT
jgi:glycosyltransferase 2 family protein